MGVELELYVLLAVLTIGSSVFAVFEVETPRWRKMLKWLLLIVVTVGSTMRSGTRLLSYLSWPSASELWSTSGGAEITASIRLYATSRRRYYELRHWEWPE